MAQQQESHQSMIKGLQEIRTDPESPQGYQDFATGLVAQNQLSAGLEFLEARLGHPVLPEQAILLARAAANMAQYEAAIALYRQLVTRYPNYSLARWEWLQALDSWGSPAAAISAYQELLLHYPSDTQLYRGLARNLIRAQQISAAIPVYEQLILRSSSDSEFEEDYLTLGQLLESTNQDDRALQVYRQAIQMFPDHCPQNPHGPEFRETSYDRLVRLLASQNRLPQALSIAAQFQPTPTAEMYFNLVLALRNQGYHEIALVLEQQLAERFPNFNRQG